LIDLRTFREPRTAGIDRERPLCPGSPWYMGQSANSPAAPPADVIERDVDTAVLAVVEVATVDRVEDGAGLPDPEQPASASASTNTVAPTRTLPATLRSRDAPRRLPTRLGDLITGDRRIVTDPRL
jgi:hypothetical protein